MILFFVNLLFDGILLLLPLFILNKLGREKPVSELWVFALPLLGIWGAYIDGFYVEFTIETGEYLASQNTLISIICLIAIFLTYIIIIHFIMGHRFKSSLIVGSIAVVVNGISWSFFGQAIIGAYSEILMNLCIIGVLLCLLVILLMLRFILKLDKQHQEHIQNGVPTDEMDFYILKVTMTAGSFGFLFLLALFNGLYLL
jgi:hypothetical protein